jgi:2-(1,2-epoxy-1,2-dihydrophenyl)acetyl-CoA isomerase
MSAAEAPIIRARDGALAVLALNNPAKLNAFSQAMRDALTAELAALNSEPEVRAIILKGAGENFSAGADMGGWSETTVQQCRTRLKRGGAALMREMVAGPKPIIAAVEGYAYGAGLALACACDYLVASASARFCCAFTRVGFIPDLALMYTLPRRVGAAKAMQLIALAEDVKAERAGALGLADEIVPQGSAFARAREVALQYCETPPLAYELMKSAFARGLETAIQAEIDLQPMAWLSQDHQEGKRAFAEKRKPKFTGR